MNYKISEMKHLKIIITSIMFLGVVGIASAQFCPFPSSSFNRYNTGSIYNGSFASNSLQTYAFNLQRTLQEGYRTGRLSKFELNNIESDYDRLAREIRWAYADRRLTFSERSRIDLYRNRLERRLRRDWNDVG